MKAFSTLNKLMVCDMIILMIKFHTIVYCCSLFLTFNL